jgi:hypothetical protein
MLSLNNFSISYASALLAATPASQLSEPEKPKRLRGLTGEQIRRMEEEERPGTSGLQAVALDSLRPRNKEKHHTLWHQAYGQFVTSNATMKTNIIPLHTISNVSAI